MLVDQVATAPTTVEEVACEGDAISSAPILVAVDFSPDSEAALLWACDHAKRIGAPVEVVHVVHDPADEPGKYNAGDGDPLMPMVEVADKMLADFLTGVITRHPETNGPQAAKTFCRPGLPSGTIVDLAQKHGAQHLVLGSRGRDGFARILLGSTSEQVVRHAPMPVTIVKAKK